MKTTEELATENARLRAALDQLRCERLRNTTNICGDHFNNVKDIPIDDWCQACKARAALGRQAKPAEELATEVVRW